MRIRIGPKAAVFLAAIAFLTSFTEAGQGNQCEILFSNKLSLISGESMLPPTRVSGTVPSPGTKKAAIAAWVREAEENGYRVGVTQNITLSDVKQAVEKSGDYFYWLNRQNQVDSSLNSLKSQQAAIDSEMKRLETEYQALEALNRPEDKSKRDALYQKILELDDKLDTIFNSIAELQEELDHIKQLPPLNGRPPEHFSLSEVSKITVSSPRIQSLQRKGALTTVEISTEAQEHLGERNGETKGIEIYPANTAVAGSSFVEVVAHELVHAETGAHSHEIKKLNNGELRGHPFQFIVVSIEGRAKEGGPEGYDDYQHASEATAFRAGALAALKVGQARIAKGAFEMSNQAIQRSLNALRGAKRSLAQVSTLAEFYTPDTYVIPVKAADGSPTHFFGLQQRMSGHKPESLSKDELMKYLDYIEQAHLKLKLANDRSLQALSQIAHQ